LASFQRQLNLYGFRRIPKGVDVGAYYHPKFQKGRRELVAEIKRVPAKPTQTRYTPRSGGIIRLPTSSSIKLAGINSLNLTPVLISEDGIQYLNLPPSDFPLTLFPGQNTPLFLSPSFAQILPKPDF
jgi:hypothetical protein